MNEELPQVYYATASPRWTNITTTAPTTETQFTGLLSQMSAGVGPLGQLGTATINASTKETPQMAKLIRYTVVNPNTHLLDVAPEHTILKQGTQMMKGDERGFLLDLALDLKAPLEAHNAALALLTYEDAEGEAKKFKAVKLSHLDVCIEVVREYK